MDWSIGTRLRQRVTFKLTGLVKTGSADHAAASHDPDGYSNGTSILVLKP